LGSGIAKRIRHQEKAGGSSRLGNFDLATTPALRATPPVPGGEPSTTLLLTPAGIYFVLRGFKFFPGEDSSCPSVMRCCPNSITKWRLQEPLLNGFPKTSTAGSRMRNRWNAGRLASHIAEMPNWATTGIKQDSLDLAAGGYTPYEASTRAELLALFDKNVRGSARIHRGLQRRDIHEDVVIEERRCDADDVAENRSGPQFRDEPRDPSSWAAFGLPA
jgi:hypothetical protein